MLYVYIGCFTFGLFYSIVSSVLGGDGGDGGDCAADQGGDDAGDIPSPFNPLVIASAITAFGAVGLISKLGFKLGDLMSSVFALSFAGITGAAIFFGVVRLMYSSQSNSSFSLSDLVGAEAEIITPVPGSGLGEIVLVVNGVRYNFTAKAAHDEVLGRGEIVRIKEMSGNIAVVTRKITINDYETYELGDRQCEKDKENNI